MNIEKIHRRQEARKFNHPLIEVDRKAGAVYVRVAKGKIDHQQAILDGLTATRRNFVADFTKDGQFIGIKIVGEFAKSTGVKRQRRR